MYCGREEFNEIFNIEGVMRQMFVHICEGVKMLELLFEMETMSLVGECIGASSSYESIFAYIHIQ